ncbi:hypothetical protein M5D96_012391 [Drosophila gunungcola]|uniref:Uncharacterized protein n=1 Tax=Drosophila gunungcola TaxID=103775 RepID=A0A9P9YDS6_9MUSC|nr:hypothetical protein M5D96_012391 [Drosophila gunungcola]
MAGPQVQHSQRPNSAYYTGLNGGGGGGGGSGGGGGGGGGGSSGGITSSASHTGLHALRQVSNETELIYRGSHSNGTVNELPSTAQHHLLTGRVPSGVGVGSGAGVREQQVHHHQTVSSIAGTGSSVTDALIGTIASGGSGGASGSTAALGIKKSSTQRSIEIIVDASQCGKELVAASSGAGGGAGAGAVVSTLDVEDVEQGGGGGQESSSSHRKSSRHRHRPLHRRLITYLRNLFQGSTTQNGKPKVGGHSHCTSHAFSWAFTFFY